MYDKKHKRFSKIKSMKIKQIKQHTIFPFSVHNHSLNDLIIVNFRMLGAVLRVKYPPVYCLHIPKPASIPCIN